MFGTTTGMGAYAEYLAVKAAAIARKPSNLSLHNFAGSDGWYPWAGVTIGSGPGGSLVLYGTTYNGGTNTGANCSFYPNYLGCGTVYSLTPPESAGGAWTEQVLYSFNGSADGALPYAGVTIGKRPNGSLVLYGATGNGGSGPPYSGAGVAFSVTPPTHTGPGAGIRSR